MLIFNFGGATLIVKHIGVSGGGFALSGTPDSLSVQPGHTATVEVMFTPTRVGYVTATLLFATNDLNNRTAGVSLDATVISRPEAGVLVSPGSLDYGDVGVGSTSTRAITIENTGNANLAIESVTTTGSGYTAIGPPTSAEIVAGTSVSLPVIFEPRSIGVRTGDIVISTNASTAPIVISLSGTGVVATPTLSVDLSSVAFGDVVIGTAGTQSIELKNSGNGDLVIPKIGVSGAGFSAGGINIPTTLLPAQTATLTVGFSPTTATSSVGSLNISSNDSRSPTLTIGLTGAGVKSAARSVTLSWWPSTSANVAGYNVYRSSVTGGPYTRIGGLVATTSFSDTTILEAQTYYYVLTAVDVDGLESGYSSEATVTVPGP